MPLLIDLKPGEKVIINGAVLENAGANTKLRICNESAILRQKEIMSDSDAATPAARVYFCLQCAYIFPDRRDHYLQLFERYLADYVRACPSATEIADEVRSEADLGHYYKALKASRKIIAHEGGVLSQMQGVAEVATASGEENEAGG
ncbi:flagellar biosynthesis repressor FlbT [Magnetospirillum sp. UT-4]|uniref:flagellar biosynthesis repressor FlbT n=1 Tax=Magnetospirillum sp. UT-4 TaxID=2681467 RepID=UPI0013850350|nr:flagellar biosynthesis repressor FlbT [Magnetospirillum sp. UT-4]CAA7618578.1 FlbT protein [Magnetospirillum sp. UT-4]